MVEHRKKMLESLCDLKNKYGMLSVKAEFEAEGSRLDELIMLNEPIARANSKLNIKIGGCEAMRDLDQCKLLGATGIMAPMIETSFAMNKFKEAASKVYSDLSDVEWIINAETITCYNNFDSILDSGDGFINTVVVGRSDLSASMNIMRNEIDGDEMFDKVRYFAIKSKQKGLKASFGGGVSLDTIPFLMNMAEYIDQFETRKVVFSVPNSAEQAEKMIKKALEFELNYLRYKASYYEKIGREDIGRMQSIEERLKF